MIGSNQSKSEKLQNEYVLRFDYIQTHNMQKFAIRDTQFTAEHLATIQSNPLDFFETWNVEYPTGMFQQVCAALKTIPTLNTVLLGNMTLQSEDANALLDLLSSNASITSLMVPHIEDVTLAPYFAHLSSIERLTLCYSSSYVSFVLGVIQNMRKNEKVQTLSIPAAWLPDFVLKELSEVLDDNTTLEAFWVLSFDDSAYAEAIRTKLQNNTRYNLFRATTLFDKLAPSIGLDAPEAKRQRSE